MADNVILKTMKCPTCGGRLKVETANEAIECIYCGNNIVPVSENASAADVGTSVTAGSQIRVEGLNNSSSALAYVDILFESFPWNAFVYSDSITVPELEEIRKNLLKTSADDKNTWFFCFEITAVPFVRKAEYTKAWFNDIIAEYKKDNPDAYGMYNMYAKAMKRLKAQYGTVVEQLRSYIAMAKKYGADDGEIAKLESRIPPFSLAESLSCHDSLDTVPEVIAFRQERNELISRRLAEKGISAADEYNRACAYINSGEYIRALTALYQLDGYLDSEKLAERVNRYFLLSDVMENCGTLYCYKKDEKHGSYSLFPTSGKKVGEKALIKKIMKVITNCANILYYLDTENRLHAFDLIAGKSIKLGKAPHFSVHDIHVRKSAGKAYLFTGSGEYQNSPSDLYELSLVDGKLTCLLKNIKSVISFDETKLAYLTDGVSGGVSGVAVFDVETNYCVMVASYGNIDICGYTGDSVIYTIDAPNANNKYLYSKPLNDQSSAMLLEKNILGFCDIIDDNVYYYIGNSRSQTLFSITERGENRTEISFCIKNILFRRGDWIYFLRGNLHNKALCRSRADGSGSSVIAGEIREFVSIKSGYFYYIDDSGTLCKVLMDGSYKEYLKHNVHSVLSINENIICYTAVDDYGSGASLNGIAQMRAVKSIYAIDTDGAGCRKLVYDIGEAYEYDDELIYYTTPLSNQNTKMFNRLNIYSGNTEELLELEFEVKGGCYIATSVYGSYDCPDVWRFRRFRDSVLAETWFGRAFIKLYYAVSPTMVKYFGESGWFKSFFKRVLDSFGESLKSKGFDDSPYDDPNW